MVLQNDKGASVKSSPRSKFEQFKKPETISSLRENDNFTESRHVQKQNSDDSDKAQEKIASDTIVIKNRKNNPAALVINADTSSDPVSGHAEFYSFYNYAIFYGELFSVGTSRRNGA